MFIIIKNVSNMFRMIKLPKKNGVKCGLIVSRPQREKKISQTGRRDIWTLCLMSMTRQVGDRLPDRHTDKQTGRTQKRYTDFMFDVNDTSGM